MEVKVREKLAEVAHSIWVKGVNDLIEEGHADTSGYYDISGFAIERIALRSECPYDHLTEDDKDLYRVEADKMLEAISATNRVGELDTLDGSTPINYREEAFKEYKEWLDDVFDEALVKALSGEVDPECPKFLTWDAAVDEVKQSNNGSL